MSGNGHVSMAEDKSDCSEEIPNFSFKGNGDCKPRSNENWPLGASKSWTTCKKFSQCPKVLSHVHYKLRIHILLLSLGVQQSSHQKSKTRVSLSGAKLS